MTPPPRPDAAGGIPSATLGPAACSISSSGVSPQDDELRPQLTQHGLVPPGGFHPGGGKAGGGGDDLRQGHQAFEGRPRLVGLKPSGRSASWSTRCQHPDRHLFTADRDRGPPPARFRPGSDRPRSSGGRRAWYFPSSGKNSRVPREAAGPLVFQGLFDGRIGHLAGRTSSPPAPAWRGNGRRNWTPGYSQSRAESRQFMGGSEDRPVSSAWICGRQVLEAFLDRCQSRKRPRTAKSGASRYGRG